MYLLTIYDYFEPILRSIIPIIIGLFNIFMIMTGLNDGDCRSYYPFIYCYCLSFIHLIIKYISIQSSQSIICIVFQWIKEYLNIYNLDVNCYENKSKNDWKYRLKYNN